MRKLRLLFFLVMIGQSAFAQKQKIIALSNYDLEWPWTLVNTI